MSSPIRFHDTHKLTGALGDTCAWLIGSALHSLGAISDTSKNPT